MASTSFREFAGTKTNGVVKLFGQVVLSTSGTISTTSCDGFAVAKTGSETGRYTVTLGQNYNKLLGCSVQIVGADDAAFTDAKGVDPKLRDIDVGTGANDGTFEIQLVDADSGADAEAQDSATLLIEITLKNSSV